MISKYKLTILAAGLVFGLSQPGFLRADFNVDPEPTEEGDTQAGEDTFEAEEIDDYFASFVPSPEPTIPVFPELSPTPEATPYESSVPPECEEKADERYNDCAKVYIYTLDDKSEASFQHIGILSLEFHVDKLSRPLL